MTGIGENIKKLRKAKGLTQDELAAKLNISGQAVSKWENGGSPDVDMLPALATAFGITIDELMGFKLNAYTDKEKFIRLMADAGALKKGDFEINGVRRKFFLDSGKFATNIHLAKLGEFFADLIMEAHVDCDCIVGLAYHGIGFAASAAIALANKYGVTVNCCHDRQKPDSRGNFFCGHMPEDGERIVLVDDLIGSGRTLEERIERLQKAADIRVAAVVAIADSFEPGMDGTYDGAKKLEAKYGARVLTVVKGDDILHAIKKGIVD